MRQYVIWIVGAATVLLGIVFMMPSGPRVATAYDPMAGRAWALTATAAQADASTTTITGVPVSTEPVRSPAAAPPARPARILVAQLPGAQATARPEQPREVTVGKPARTEPDRRRPQLQAGTQAEVAPSSATIATTLPAVPADAGVPQYALEDVADKYEADESKFPLDRTVTNAGITLGLIGLERLDKTFVLKVAIINAGSADFFVKSFAVAAANQNLGSRAIFSLLVEPHRTREGYVVFVKPPSGAGVEIKLQEDEGKGRAFDLAIPYSF